MNYVDMMIDKTLYKEFYVPKLSGEGEILGTKSVDLVEDVDETELCSFQPKIGGELEFYFNIRNNSSYADADVTIKLYENEYLISTITTQLDPNNSHRESKTINVKAFSLYKIMYNVSHSGVRYANTNIYSLIRGKIRDKMNRYYNFN